jgi:hypothetical protein
MSRSNEDALLFIAASFPSVWALELMLTLKREGRPRTRHDLNETLRASALVVSKAVDALVAAGIASIEGEAVVLSPVNRDVEDWLEQVEHLYRTRPNMVRRVIVAASTTSGATAFADAFRVRSEKDD